MGKRLAFRGAVDESDADLVLMMDVLEHVEDDVGLVCEYADKVAYGTRFIVTVPAFMWLWSGHDIFLAHFRRYTLAGIEDVLRAAGLTVDRGCYFYASLLPLVALARRAERWRRMRNPSQGGQSFRRKADTDSDGSRTVIPIDPGRP